MSKLVQINNCMECPHSFCDLVQGGVINPMYFCEKVAPRKQVRFEIPEWCPLEDVKSE